MRPATRTLLPILAALALAPEARAAGWESIENLPGRSAITVTVKGKPRVYFHLTPEKPMSVALAGPAQLRVISRAVLSGRKGDTAAYRIAVHEGGKTLQASDEKAGEAANVSTPGVVSLGRGRRMTVQVPDGQHELQLVLTGVPAVLVRLQRSAPAGAEAWVSLTPLRAARGVSVVEGEKSIAYYSALRDQPVVLRIVGPTTLDLLTRLDFDETMHGVQAYRLRVAERGKTVREVEFRTTKAVTATYSNLADRVPSKFDRLSLPVGGGLHEIEIQLLTPAGGAVEIHARIPQPSVGNTE